MKKFVLIFTLIVVALCAFTLAKAQKVNYTTNSGLTIGFGLGASYQKSDINNSRGYGFDFTLGHHLYNKENSFFGYDWKFRFLGGENRAHDHRINLDGTYSNVRYDFFNYDLEFGLTLNRLRERTRIILTGFAGAGITHGRISTDLYDENNSLYDYSLINPNQTPAQINKDLLELSDRTYETRMENKAAVLPTLGIYLGYQFTRSFSLGIEHKTNFSLSEKTSIVGINMDNNIVPGSGIDRNNYTSLAFKWSFGGKSNRNVSRYSTIPSSPATGLTPIKQYTEPGPSVSIFDPSVNLYNTTIYTYSIKAKVFNIQGSGNITFYQDGVKNPNFTYSPTTNNFEAIVNLLNGENTFRIVANNPVGSAEDKVTIIAARPVANKPVGSDEVNATRPVAKLLPPAVNITKPSDNPHTTTANRIDITAQVLNIRTNKDIQVIFNGQSIGFDHYPTNNIVRTILNLAAGTNTLVIAGENEVGSAKDNITIIYNKPAVSLPTATVITSATVPPSPPVVKIINPSAPVSVQHIDFTVSAQTVNVQSRQDVTVRINGTSTNNFSFNTNGVITTNIALAEGPNTIEVTGRNKSGVTSDITNITYTKTLTALPPVVNVLIPEENPYRTYEDFEDMNVSVLNVKNIENIVLNINGINTNNFTFNSKTLVLKTKVPLNDGKNIVTITARNEDGQDAKSQIIIKEMKPCPLPMITLINPAQNPLTTNKQSHTIELSSINTKNVLVKYKGKNYTNFLFNPANGQILIMLDINDSRNIIEIIASNECGSATKLVEFVYIAEVPCNTPAIILMSNNNETVFNNQHLFQAQVNNITNSNQLTLTVNGRIASSSFSNNIVSFNAPLDAGTNTFVLDAKNECGSDSRTTTIIYKPEVVEVAPCLQPSVTFAVTAVDRNDASHELKGIVTNVKNKSEITLTVNGQTDNNFQYVPTTSELLTKFKLQPGKYIFIVSATNECGQDTKSITITIEEPCLPPSVNFAVSAVDRNDASHELKGLVSNVKNKSEITLTVNGQADNSFQYFPNTNELLARFKLQPGTHTFIVVVRNECGQENKSITLKLEEEKTCGPRINPGNAAWQFCLITPDGTYNRDSLTNRNFTYSGPATSLYIMPIAGGGDAIVNGKPYNIKSGQYYLFTGKMMVTISTKNPGSMGHWSVCINTDKEPISGSGNNRPESPCEVKKDDGNSGNREKNLEMGKREGNDEEETKNVRLKR